jgi:predicted PurR-regulated permease PerM
LTVLIAILIAVMLDPVVVWLEAHRVRKTIGVLAISVIVFGLLIAFLFVLLPAIGRQVAEVSKQAPALLQRLGIQMPALPPTRDLLLRGAVAGKFAIAGLAAIVFVLVVAMYLLVEGRMAFAWLITFAPRLHRKRIDKTAREMSEVVLAYMRGNVITSIICAAYVLVVLTVLHVPLTLLLAVIAFVFDFIPVVGTIAMIAPAALLALTVSPLRAMLVVAAYLAYHLIENYLIIPRVYGNQMRLSTLTVILAIAVGGTLQGVIGALLALPIAAAYPIVERIWLRDQLPSDTVERHEELQDA